MKADKFKFGTNIYRSGADLQWYFNKCDGHHYWENANTKNGRIEIQCKHCGVLATAKPKMIKKDPVNKILKQI